MIFHDKKYRPLRKSKEEHLFLIIKSAIGVNSSVNCFLIAYMPGNTIQNRAYTRLEMNVYPEGFRLTLIVDLSAYTREFIMYWYHPNNREVNRLCTHPVCSLS